MMEPEETPEERLERLRRGTEAVRARGHFASQTMARLQAEVSWYVVLLGPARRLLPVAAVAAAAACSLAYLSDRAAADALALVDEPAEVEW